MENNEVEKKDEDDGFETRAGITLAVVATILAVSDLGAGKFGEDEIMFNNEKAAAYQWFSSKGIKQDLAEGQANLVRVMLDSGSVVPAQVEGLNKLVGDLQADVSRYKKEKKEILLGSATVGASNWVQDIDGEMGKVIGAKEWEKRLVVLSSAGDVFDLSTLFLQLGLLLGALSLVIKKQPLRRTFYWSLVGMGLVGFGLAWRAFSIALV